MNPHFTRSGWNIVNWMSPRTTALASWSVVELNDDQTP
jgi:hypothetical protein